jgi:hypothetical protein
MHVRKSFRSLTEAMALRVKPLISLFFVTVDQHANQAGRAGNHQSHPGYCVVKSPVHALPGKNYPLIP